MGLAIKTRRYLDVIPEAMLEEANRLGFPLINIPVQYPLSKICKVVFGRLSGGGVEKADRFVSLYHSITESMLEADGVSRMLGVLSDFIGNAVLLLGAKWELMAYAENAGNPMPLSRYLPLQKGEVIFPESITGNMPSDFSKYAKAIKRVFSAGEERAVCRILPVSGGNAPVWLLGGVGDRPQNAIGGISGLGDRGLFLGAGALPHPPDRGDPDAYPAGLL